MYIYMYIALHFQVLSHGVFTQVYDRQQRTQNVAAWYELVVLLYLVCVFVCNFVPSILGVSLHLLVLLLGVYISMWAPSAGVILLVTI